VSFRSQRITCRVSSALAVLACFALGAAANAAPQSNRKPGGYTADASRALRELADGQFERVAANFDSHLALELPGNKLREQWGQFTTQTGPFKKIITSELTPELGGYEAVTIVCEFEHTTSANVLVTFDSAGKIAGLYFGPKSTDIASEWHTPVYADPSKFSEEALTLKSGAWRLPATLTLPNGPGPFPGVVLLPGSPPIDQDATVGPNKIFKDIAWGLASRGLAVLRYAKRSHAFGAGLGLGEISFFSLREESNEDARAALALLSERKDIDHQHTFVLGHSLGGFAAPQIAAENSSVKGIIALGAPAGDLLGVLIERMRAQAAAGGPQAAVMAQGADALENVQKGRVDAGSLIELFGQRVPVAFWTEQRNYQPGAATAKLRLPALVLVGKHDAEVPPDDIDLWRQALANCKDAVVKFYPDLFHLFMPSTATGNGDSPEDWSRAAHVSEQVIHDITAWTLAHSDSH
jgi:uncharacterized protein